MCCRYSCCGIVCGSHLVLVGGVTWDCISPHVIIVDLKALKWTSVRVRVSVHVVRVRVSVHVVRVRVSVHVVSEGECVRGESTGECMCMW